MVSQYTQGNRPGGNTQHVCVSIFDQHVWWVHRKQQHRSLETTLWQDAITWEIHQNKSAAYKLFPQCLMHSVMNKKKPTVLKIFKVILSNVYFSHSSTISILNNTTIEWFAIVWNRRKQGNSSGCRALLPRTNFLKCNIFSMGQWDRHTQWLLMSAFYCTYGQWSSKESPTFTTAASKK